MCRKAIKLKSNQTKTHVANEPLWKRKFSLFSKSCGNANTAFCIVTDDIGLKLITVGNMTSKQSQQTCQHFYYVTYAHTNDIDGSFIAVTKHRSRCLEHDVARNSQVLHWNISIPLLRHALDIPIYWYWLTVPTMSKTYNSKVMKKT